MRTPLALCASLVLLATTSAAQSPPPTAPTFRFAPPADVEFVQTLVTTRERTLGDAGRQTDRSTIKARITIRPAANGFTVVMAPFSASMTRNGKPAPDPLIELIGKTRVQYDVTRDGRLERIHGLEDFTERLAASVPPRARQAISRLVSREALENRATTEWDGRFAALVGRPAHVGASWTGEDAFPLPTGTTLTMYSTTRVEGEAPCGPRTCVRLTFAFNTDATALNAMAKGVMNEVVAAAPKAEKVAPTAIKGATMQGSGERLIEPDTLLIHRELLKRITTMTMRHPLRGELPATVVETREYTYEYPPPAAPGD